MSTTTAKATPFDNFSNLRKPQLQAELQARGINDEGAIPVLLAKLSIDQMGLTQIPQHAIMVDRGRDLWKMTRTMLQSTALNAQIHVCTFKSDLVPAILSHEFNRDVKKFQGDDGLHRLAAQSEQLVSPLAVLTDKLQEPSAPPTPSNVASPKNIGPGKDVQSPTSSMVDPSQGQQEISPGTPQSENIFDSMQMIREANTTTLRELEAYYEAQMQADHREPPSEASRMFLLLHTVVLGELSRRTAEQTESQTDVHTRAPLTASYPVLPPAVDSDRTDSDPPTDADTTTHEPAQAETALDTTKADLTETFHQRSLGMVTAAPTKTPLAAALAMFRDGPVSAVHDDVSKQEEAQSAILVESPVVAPLTDVSPPLLGAASAPQSILSQWHIEPSTKMVALAYQLSNFAKTNTGRLNRSLNSKPDVRAAMDASINMFDVPMFGPGSATPYPDEWNVDPTLATTALRDFENEIQGLRDHVNETY